MKIKYSPQYNDKEFIKYTFNGEVVKAEIYRIIPEESSSEHSQNQSNNNLVETIYIDLSNVGEGKFYDIKFPTINTKKDGELYVELVNYIGEDATEDEKFPEWFESEDEEFEVPEDAEIIQLEELIIPEPEPSPVESLVKENAELKRSIDSLRSSIIQSNKDTEDLIVTLLAMM